ncbi:FAD/NAD(P)-binding domain-containing protein [Mycena venus]|uniref:FAD/NAD(P)-binding domain-containing protein n=1 Tax=Mycena venus TaxID=2733690 RepID=A0A8H7DDY8_9AGAR|nr:FAD/NAD(P)-binding domain-containing protein [Mycena venus]
MLLLAKYARAGHCFVSRTGPKLFRPKGTSRGFRSSNALPTSIEADSKKKDPTEISRAFNDAAPGKLNIAVIGAGLVGLATTAMLRRAGHRITIFESSSFHAEIGAGIVLPPNGVGVLKNNLPELNWENMQPVDFRSMEMFNVDGTYMETEDLSEGWSKYSQGYFMIHRVDLHKELMRMALEPNAIAFPPATIRLGAPIRTVDFDSDRPSVTTSTGEEFNFDLVLGTDGIKSTVRKFMVGTEYDAPATQLAFYRWMIDLRKNPGLSWIRDDRSTPGPTMIIGGENIMGLIAYPVRRGNVINFSGAHFDTRDQDAVDWNSEVPKEAFLGAFDDFADKFKALVTIAERPGAWQLRKLPPLPTWIKGNVALLGDAAHAMFPTYGQGFAVGVEDAATVATLFPSGTKKSDIPSRLKMFQEIRKPRAEHVSQMSTDAYKPPDEKSPEGSFVGWLAPELLDYDPVAVTKAALSKI